MGKVKSNVTEDQKQRMVENLKKSFGLLNTVMELKLAYLKKMHPDKNEAELIQKIHLDVVESKEKQWDLLKT
jgi:hypothetical protein